MKNYFLLSLTLIALFAVDLFIASPIHLSFSAYMPDAKLGWTPKRGFARELIQRDAAGNTYKVNFSLDHKGFREFGDPSTKNLKILFLGDSYTGDPKAGNKNMYFSVFKSALRDRYGLDAEIFAAGGGGWGTLQQYLFIRDYIDLIKPDICILQFCDNDFTNNYFEWEKYSIARNQKYLRPYYSLETDSIHYDESLWARFYRAFYNRSFLFRGVDAVVRRMQCKYYFYKFEKYKGKYYDEYSPLTISEAHRLLKDSYPVTRKLLLLLKGELSNNVELFTFFPPANIDLQSKNSWLDISRECGFMPLLSPIIALDEAESKGEVILNSDGGHYNDLGNRIMGEALAGELFSYLINDIEKLLNQD